MKIQQQKNVFRAGLVLVLASAVTGCDAPPDAAEITRLERDEIERLAMESLAQTHLDRLGDTRAILDLSQSNQNGYGEIRLILSVDETTTVTSMTDTLLELRRGYPNARIYIETDKPRTRATRELIQQAIIESGVDHVMPGERMPQ